MYIQAIDLKKRPVEKSSKYLVSGKFLFGRAVQLTNRTRLTDQSCQ